ncbi:hypothetical protein [Marinobacter sp.]|jgi:hypothetical protein|uniref:hypothetical protein n=1 Tax=Marinobacter sp. TaxID=50741 RepID=UPI0026109D8D|nr:hypothetical protein [Marinobacter sp.]
MAEARDVSVNREYIVSGFLSGQAYRLAVRVDSAAARLIRLGLRDFDKARSLEQEIFGALTDLENTAKTARKMIDKVNRRRREGVPTGGPKQTFMVRSLPSAHAFRCAVAVDQIQRDISMLGLASSGDVAKVAADAQSALTEAINIADSIIQSVIKKTDSRRQPNKQTKAKAPTDQKAQPAKAQPTKAQSSEKSSAAPDSKNEKQKSAPSAGKVSGAPGDKSKASAKKASGKSSPDAASPDAKTGKATASA